MTIEGGSTSLCRGYGNEGSIMLTASTVNHGAVPLVLMKRYVRYLLASFAVPAYN